jgi:hypothetical protein
MAGAVITKNKPTDRLVQSRADGNIRVKYIDFTSDTGDYASGGFTVTAASIGLRHVSFVATSGGVATQGTAGASGVGVGVTYASDGASFTVWLYETGASSGAPLSQKGAEAMVANFTIRLKVEGH